MKNFFQRLRKPTGRILWVALGLFGGVVCFNTGDFSPFGFALVVMAVAVIAHFYIKSRKIRVKTKVRTPYGVGIVIAIDPDASILPFLVEIKGWHKGHDGYMFWDKSWYPQEYKTPSNSRLWFEGEDLRKI